MLQHRSMWIKSVGCERGVQGVEEDYLLLVNGGEKSGALYVSVQSCFVFICFVFESPVSDKLYKLQLRPK